MVCTVYFDWSGISDHSYHFDDFSSSVYLQNSKKHQYNRMIPVDLSNEANHCQTMVITKIFKTAVTERKTEPGGIYKYQTATIDARPVCVYDITSQLYLINE